MGWTTPTAAVSHPKDRVPIFKKFMEVDVSINRNKIIQQDKVCASELRRQLIRRNIKIVNNKERIEKLKLRKLAKQAKVAKRNQAKVVASKEGQLQRAEAASQEWFDEREDRWAQKCKRAWSLSALEHRIERGLPYGLVSAVRLKAIGSLDLGAPVSMGMSSRSMRQMCWLVVVSFSRSSATANSIVEGIEKQKPILLDNFRKMALARLIQAGIVYYVRRKLRAKSLACVQTFARDFSLCLQMRFALNLRKFFAKVEEAQGYMVGFLKVQDARAELLDKVWCLVENSVMLNLNADNPTSPKTSGGRKSPVHERSSKIRRNSELTEYMHKRMYSHHSVMEVLHMLRHQSEFEGRAYEKTIKREIRKMQAKGVLSKTLKPHGHVMLAKMLRPRPEAEIPKATVPKEMRRTVLLRYLSKCRSVHRHSPEMVSSFNRLTQSEEIHKTTLQVESMRWMLHTDQEAVKVRVQNSLTKHGSVFPEVEKQKIEWPCVRALTDRRFGGMFVEAIEEGIKEHRAAVARHATDVAKRRREAEEHRRREVPEEYLKICMDSCEAKYMKVPQPTQWDKLHARTTTANESRRNSWSGRERHYERKKLHGER
jgi:hypothetical protein